jgi:hypothetical protein
VEKVNIQSFQSELSDNDYYYEYDRSLPIKDQILDSQHNLYLLNVRKVYTNNTYFGVKFSILNAQKNSYIAHNFYCKDRGFTEEKVNTLDGFYSARSKEYIFRLAKHTEEEFGFTYQKQDLTYPPINGRVFSIYYAYDKLQYKNTSFVFEDNNAVWRGLYGASQEQFDDWDLVANNKESYVLHDSIPSKKQLDEFYHKAVVSFSNTIYEENTAYSKIKIYKPIG